MNDEFQARALMKVEPPQEYPDTSRKPLPKTIAEMVLGHEPHNRHDRRKATKLLRSKR
jgi:hypothetical protein